MVTHLTRSLVERTRHRLRRPDDEAGSLILDILIGMAIFALIAIIAVSAIGQYRMRAYTQAAMSDAEQVATAIAGHVTDNVTKSDAGTYPTGLLDTAALETLDVAVTTSGPEASKVTVTPAETDPERFTVCVEHRGAYAVYDSDAGLVDSGDAERENFDGCATTTGPVDGGGTGGGGGGETEQPAVAAPTNLTVTADSTQRTLTATWDEVPDASAYNLTLDGQPAWNGTATEATITDVDPGEHAVAVAATVAGQTSLPSQPATATVRGNNDSVAFAQPLTIGDPMTKTVSVDLTTVDFTTEPGEDWMGGYRSAWFTFTPPRDGSYNTRRVADSTGATIGGPSQWSLFEGTFDSVPPAGTPRVLKPGVGALWENLKAGQPYLVRMATGSASGLTGRYRMEIYSPPVNDDYAQASVINPNIGTGDEWLSANTESQYAAGFQNGEPTDNGKSVWWTFTPTRSGEYSLDMVANSRGDVVPTPSNVSFHWWTSAEASSPAALPAAGAGSGTATSGHLLTFNATAGQTYRFRVGHALYTNATNHLFRLKVSAPAE